jgi:hypothetical protein
MSANTFHSAGVGFENGYKSEGLAHILEIASPEPRAAGAAPDFNAYGRRDRSRRGTGKGSLRPFGFISGGCLKVRTIYSPRLLSGGRDAGLFVAGQC